MDNLHANNDGYKNVGKGMTQGEFADMCRENLRIEVVTVSYANDVLVELEVFNGSEWVTVSSAYIYIPKDE